MFKVELFLTSTYAFNMIPSQSLENNSKSPIRKRKVQVSTLTRLSVDICSSNQAEVSSLGFKMPRPLKSQQYV